MQTEPYNSDQTLIAPSSQQSRSWRSLEMVTQDIADLECENYRLGQALCTHTANLELLEQRFNKVNESFTQTVDQLNQTQNELRKCNEVLSDEKAQHDIVRKSLDFEFFMHSKTEQLLAEEQEANGKLLSIARALERHCDWAQQGSSAELMSEDSSAQTLETIETGSQRDPSPSGSRLDVVLGCKEQELAALERELAELTSDSELSS